MDEGDTSTWPSEGHAGGSLWEDLPRIVLPLTEARFLDLVERLTGAERPKLDMRLEDGGLDSLALMELVALLQDAGANCSDELIASWLTLRDIFAMYAVSAAAADHG